VTARMMLSLNSTLPPEFRQLLEIITRNPKVKRSESGLSYQSPKHVG
jgi:hypothetical protein